MRLLPRESTNIVIKNIIVVTMAPNGEATTTNFIGRAYDQLTIISTNGEIAIPTTIPPMRALPETKIVSYRNMLMTSFFSRPANS